MDDILASIRRIISDDDPASTPVQARPPERAPGLRSDPSQARSSQPAASRQPERQDGYAPRRPGAPLGGAATPRSERTGRPVESWVDRPIPGALGDPFDGLDMPQAPAQAYASPYRPAREDEPLADRSYHSPSVPEPLPQHPSAARENAYAQRALDAEWSPDAYRFQDGARPKDLLSPDVDAAVAAAFGALGELVVPAHERTIEDLVKEILRPMLKTWLDDNLPGIVEGLVRQEIERISRQAR